MFSMIQVPMGIYVRSEAGSMAGSLLLADRRKSRFERCVHRTTRECLALGAEELLHRDPKHRRHVRKVLVRQRKLRGKVDASGFRAYMKLEEAEVARWSYALERVMVWAFARGRRRRRT